MQNPNGITSGSTSFILLLALAAGVLPFACSPASAASCPNIFLDGQSPSLSKPSLRANTQELCYTHFALLHSGVARTPLWSAEHLTRDDVASAREMIRDDVFHADPSLSPQDRAELADYRGSGYDRGHMAPSGDMPDSQSQEESFSLANMIPQNPDNNRRLWAGIEKAVRDLASRTGEVYVVTGPIFAGNALSSLRGRVLVPTSVYKAVFVPATGQAGAYVAVNAAGNDWRRVSLADLETLSGVVAFPVLNAGVRASSPEFLPSPLARGHSASDADAAAPAVEDGSPQNIGGATVGGAVRNISGVMKNMAEKAREKGVDGVRDAARAWTINALRKGLDRLTREKGEDVENPYQNH